MTIYRRRVASSFAALARTLEGRLETLRRGQVTLFDEPEQLEEDLPDDELDDEVLDSVDALQFEQAAVGVEERGSIDQILQAVKRLPTDS